MSSVPSRYRPELRALISLALPIWIAQVAQAGMGTIDTLIAGQISPNDLAAVGIGASLWLPCTLFIAGLLSVATTLIAQLRGAERHDQMPMTLAQSIILGGVIGTLLALVMLLLAQQLEALGVSAALADEARHYLYWIAPSLPASGFYFALRAASDGLGQTQLAMRVSVLCLLLNIPLDLWFAFGGLGVPALGGEGCGLATTLLQWLAVALLILQSRRNPALQVLRGWSHQLRPYSPLQRQLLRIGLPAGITVVAEIGLFSVIALLMANLGTTAVAAHQIALSVSGLTFMLPLSLGIALSLQVGHAVGAGHPQLARQRWQIGLQLSLLAALINALLMGLLPGPIVQLYTDDEAVKQLAATLLGLAAFYQLPDALQVNANSALRGYHDTRVPLLIGLLAYWGLALPLGYLLAMTDLIIDARGAPGFWLGLAIGFSSSALLLLIRLFWRGRQPLAEAGLPSSHR